MQLQAAVLCDFAQVREGMLFISSGGVTRSFTPVPAPMPVWLALVMQLEPPEIEQAHEVSVVVNHAGNATELGRATLGFQTPPPNEIPGLHPGEVLVVPVAIPLMAILAQQHGMHDVRISIDGGDTTILTLYLIDPAERPQMGGPAQM